jgi:DNA-binding NarL/FixJ family response regulator
LKVLIVDDSDILRERLRSILGELRRVEVTGEAVDALEAKSMLEQHTPDVVILDIRMPKGSGIDILEMLKKKKPNVKVIVLTNYPYPQYRKRCLEAGAEYFLDKSTEFDKLPDIFKQLAEQTGGKE